MNKGSLVGLAVVVAVGCGQAESRKAPSSSEPPLGVTASQLEAFDVLEKATGRSWSWLQNEALGTPMHLAASRTQTAPVRERDLVRATLGWLGEHRALFRMRDPELELLLERSTVDELGMTHTRFRQVAHGIPVVGGELAAHYDKDGRLVSVDAHYVPDLQDADVQPALSPDDVLSVVTTELAGGDDEAAAALEPGAPRLVIYAPEAPSRQQPRLTYEVTVRALKSTPPAIWVVTVDAKTGHILHRYDNFQTLKGRGVGVLGDAKEIEVSASNQGYVMVDQSRGVRIATYTAEQKFDTATLVTSGDPNSWDTGVPGAGAAVDAHAHAAVVYDYYKQRHGRDSIDGAGGPLISVAHFGEDYPNAGWDGQGMLYGDGGNVNVGGSDVVFRPLSLSLDVVAHEFTHGVIEQTSKLAYENQSGALNEALADIFGTFIEHWAQPDNGDKWTVGEKVLSAGGPLRDMKNPASGLSSQPAHMSEFINTQQDNGGVHANSGIINNAAYLMTVGGRNPVSKIEVPYGIGWAKSEKVWYRANAQYFLERTNFGQAAQGVLEAAKDLGMSSDEIDIIECAFIATGIAQGECRPVFAPPSDGEEAQAAVEEGIEGAKAPRTRRRRLVSRSDSACSAGPTPSSSGTAPLAVVLFALVVRRLGVRAARGSHTLAERRRPEL